MPRSKRISEESSASGQVSAASADDEAVEQGPPIEVEDETGDESIPEEAWEEGAAEAEEPEADFEMVTCEDEGSGKVADVNPESPPQTPRANWTAEDFARLETVMRDLGHLNRQLLSFNNAAVEEDQAQADDQASASGPVASASASDQIVQPELEAEHPESHGEPGFSSACDRKPGLGQESRGSGVWGLKKVYSFPSFTRLQAAIQGPNTDRGIGRGAPGRGLGPGCS